MGFKSLDGTKQVVDKLQQAVVCPVAEWWLNAPSSIREGHTIPKEAGLQFENADS